jgi:hypothetical protein
MIHHKVTSSNIDSIAYKMGVLHVRFKNGGLYEYLGVSPEQFMSLKEAESVGKHLNGMCLKGKKVTT